MTQMTDTPIYIFNIDSEQDSIRAAIRTILLTSKGEVPFRPNFGLGAENLLGGTMNSTDIAYEVATQLSTYEPRIKVKRVITTPDGTGRIGLDITYEILKNKETHTINI